MISTRDSLLETWGWMTYSGRGHTLLQTSQEGGNADLHETHFRLARGGSEQTVPTPFFFPFSGVTISHLGVHDLVQAGPQLVGDGGGLLVARPGVAGRGATSAGRGRIPKMWQGGMFW